MQSNDRSDNTAPGVRGIEHRGRVPARALVGWMDDYEAEQWLSGKAFAPTRDPVQREIVRRAKATVAARAPVEARLSGQAELPPEVQRHLALLRTHPESADKVAQMGEARLVDLHEVIAAQKQIMVGEAENRAAHAAPDNLLSLAGITLPLQKREPIAWNFDAARNAFILVSPDPNLAVVGHFNSTVSGESPGVVFDGLGFAVAHQRSYMQIAVIDGKPILRDGYHRAFGLLMAGIRRVPAFVQHYANWEAAGMPMGLLAKSQCLGPQPPLLTDYLNDELAPQRWVPAHRRMIMIQAVEVNVPA